MLMEQLEYNLLLEGDVAEKFFQLVLTQACAADLLSDEHFRVDGTLIEVWAARRVFNARTSLHRRQMIRATRRRISMAKCGQ
jgi:hypothetical protein